MLFSYSTFIPLYNLSDIDIDTLLQCWFNQHVSHFCNCRCDLLPFFPNKGHSCQLLKWVWSILGPFEVQQQDTICWVTLHCWVWRQLYFRGAKDKLICLRLPNDRCHIKPPLQLVTMAPWFVSSGALGQVPAGKTESLNQSNQPICRWALLRCMCSPFPPSSTLPLTLSVCLSQSLPLKTGKKCSHKYTHTPVWLEAVKSNQDQGANIQPNWAVFLQWKALTWISPSASVTFLVSLCLPYSFLSFSSLWM